MSLKPAKELDRLSASLIGCSALLAASLSESVADKPSADSIQACVAEARDAVQAPALRLQTLRPRVGTAALLTAGGALAGKILVGARKGSHGIGRYATPGGHLENGEEWDVCCMRELEEETGLALAPERFSLFTVTNDIMAEEGLHYITLFMHATLTDDEVAKIVNAEPDKCEGWEWHSAAELRSLPLFVPMTNLLASGKFPA